MCCAGLVDKIIFIKMYLGSLLPEHFSIFWGFPELSDPLEPKGSRRIPESKNPNCLLFSYGACQARLGDLFKNVSMPKFYCLAKAIGVIQLDAIGRLWSRVSVE